MSDSKGDILLLHNRAKFALFATVAWAKFALLVTY